MKGTRDASTSPTEEELKALQEREAALKRALEEKLRHKEVLVKVAPENSRGPHDTLVEGPALPPAAEMEKKNEKRNRHGKEKGLTKDAVGKHKGKRPDGKEKAKEKGKERDRKGKDKGKGKEKGRVQEGKGEKAESRTSERKKLGGHKKEKELPAEESSESLPSLGGTKRSRSESSESSSASPAPPTKRQRVGESKKLQVRAVKRKAAVVSVPPTKNVLSKSEFQARLKKICEDRPWIAGCRSVDTFKKLNRIEEGTYGVVYRAEVRATKEIVALKRVKFGKHEREGFPITALREAKILLRLDHENIVNVREIVTGDGDNSIFLVMDFVDHELKHLMESNTYSFTLAEVKTLTLQLLKAVEYMHSNWILHRDLKTSNLLYTNTGVLKVADFGMAREFGSPLRKYTDLVVTLFYRAPELLLGQELYSTGVDMWSVGCILAEMVMKKTLIAGTSELDQLDKMFKLLGTPNDDIWPGYSSLPLVGKMAFTSQPHNFLRRRITSKDLSDEGFDLLMGMLRYDPSVRTSATSALEHPWFTEKPSPCPEWRMPTFPSANEGGPNKRRSKRSPAALLGANDNDDGGGFKISTSRPTNGMYTASNAFSLKF